MTGDVVVLEPGDRVPADIRLTRAASLRAVGAALTGESEPVDKDAETLAAAGAGEGIVVATGGATEFGRIAALVRGTPDEEMPLQVRLRAFGRWLVIGCLATVALVFALGIARGIAWGEMLLTSISLLSGAELAAVVTVALVPVTVFEVWKLVRRRP